MKDLIATYALLPLVYIMFKAGELAVKKGRKPFTWQLLAFLVALTAGLIAGGLTWLLITITADNPGIYTVIGWIVAAFILFSLTAGLLLLSQLKKRIVGSQAKRSYRPYDLKNAFLFPRIIPRGGFLWRAIVYHILISITVGLITVIAMTSAVFLAALPLPAFIAALLILLYVSLAVLSFGMLYYISHICIPRIRDAGLSRDTLIILFVPGMNLVALLIILVTPTSRFGRTSI